MPQSCIRYGAGHYEQRTAQCINRAFLQVTPCRIYKCLKLFYVYIFNLWILVAMLCNEFMSLLQSLLHGAEITVFMYAYRVMYF